MPCGNYPNKGVHDAERRKTNDGFTHKGRDSILEGAPMIGSEPSVSPSSETCEPLGSRAFRQSIPSSRSGSTKSITAT